MSVGADARHDLDADRGQAGSIPVLEPVLVVAGDDVEPLLRTARAGVAQLTLQLRTVLREAEAVEHGGAVAASPDTDAATDADVAAAEELLRTSIDRRRRELASGLEVARRDAAQRVADADREAADLIKAARAEMSQLLEILRASGRDVVASSPNLRVVADDEVPVRPAERVEPTIPVERLEPIARVEPIEPVSPVIAPAPIDIIAPRSEREPGTWSRYLYLDVVLPLLAAVIVVVVLLAWVG